MNGEKTALPSLRMEKPQNGNGKNKPSTNLYIYK